MNVFYKSTLRQPLRSAVLLILVVAAAFAAIMRLSEYIVLTNTINNIGGYYRSIGFLRNTEGSGSFANVYAGAGIVAQSPYVAYEDRRRGAEGVLQDMTNSDITGTMRLYDTGETGPFEIRNTDAFFYGEVIVLLLT